MFQSASTSTLSPGHNASPSTPEQSSKHEKRRGSGNPPHLASISEHSAQRGVDKVDGKRSKLSSVSDDKDDPSGPLGSPKSETSADIDEAYIEAIEAMEELVMVDEHFDDGTEGEKKAHDDQPVRPPRKKKAAQTNSAPSQAPDNEKRPLSPQRSLSSPTGFSDDDGAPSASASATASAVPEYEQYQKLKLVRVSSDSSEYLSTEKKESDENFAGDKKRRKNSLFQLFKKKDEVQDDASALGKQYKSENDLKHFTRSTSNTSVSTNGASTEALNDVVDGAPHKDKKEGFVRKMSKKMRHAVVGKKWEETVEEVLVANNKKLGHRFTMIDLSMEDVPESPPSKKIYYSTYCQMGMCASCFCLRLL